MIDLDDIQRLVVRPPRADAMTIDFVHADSKRDLRTFFRSAVGAVTVATDRPAVTVTVGVASAGLRLAGIDRRAHDALTPAFRSGMRHAASALGDVGDSDPAHWIAPFDGASDEVHAVVIRQHDLGATFPPLAGGRTVARWTGARRPADDEPFGFADGITDPVIAGSGKELRLGNGVWDPTRRAWRPVAAGEAVLGYVDESGAVAGHADLAHVERNGSYLVVRKLEQHVEELWRACTHAARALEPDLAGPELDALRDAIATQLVGRTKDGRLADPSLPSSHIRRANPHGGIEFADRIVPRHILFRRGIPYADDDGTVGLLFLACCADLRRQFEFVQSQWLQDGNRFGLSDERDGLTGWGTHDGTIVHEGTVVKPSLPQVVTTRGGEYFLLPGRSALELLADGHA